MKPHRPHTAASPRLPLMFAAFALCLAAAAAASAQPRPPGSGRDLGDSERDILAREAETNRKREAPKKDPNAVMAEVNEDFAALRALGDELKKASEAQDPVDHAAASRTSSEVKRRATRLEANLAGLPKDDKGKRAKYSAPADDAQVRASLKTLGEVLTAFLTNPVFSDVGTLDPQLAVKARRDLEAVLALSEAVRKGTEKLAKR